MGLALQLTEQHFLQKLTELFRRTIPTILEIFQDRLILDKEISMTGLTTTFDSISFNFSYFHIHHLLLYRN